LNQDPDLKADINRMLAKEGLQYNHTIQVKHLLSVLYHDVGLERVKEKLAATYRDLPIAVSYGCHALRPSAVTGFDDPFTPTIFDELVEATGAGSVEWARKLDCCGAPLTGINDRIAVDMATKKINNARKSGAQFICIACPYSQLHFEDVQTHKAEIFDNRPPVPLVLYPQLLGLCMGIDWQTLGIDKNKTDLSGITSYLKAD
jgi:heterodisulfide reductase subunit B